MADLVKGVRVLPDIDYITNHLVSYCVLQASIETVVTCSVLL